MWMDIWLFSWWLITLSSSQLLLLKVFPHLWHTWLNLFTPTSALLRAHVQNVGGKFRNTYLKNRETFFKFEVFLDYAKWAHEHLNLCKTAGSLCARTTCQWSNFRTLGLFHWIAFLGSGSSGVPMDFCSAGKVGSENSTPDFRHSAWRVSKSWSLNLIGFSVEPRGASLLVAIVSVGALKNAIRCQMRELKYSKRKSAHPPDQARAAGAPPRLCPAWKGMRAPGGPSVRESE